MQKTIKINPELFSLKNKKTENKSLKRAQKKSLDGEKSNNVLTSTNVAKKKLLERVKELQKQKQSQSHETNNVSSKSNNVSNFDETMNFLQTLSQKHEKRGHQTPKSMKVRKSANEIIDTKLPEELSRLEHNIGETTSYGCLKNGTLPTYRDWKRMTQKKTTMNSSSFKEQQQQQQQQPLRLKINTDLNTFDDRDPPPISTREQRLNELRKEYKDKAIESTEKKSNVIDTVDIVNIVDTKAEQPLIKIDRDRNIDEQSKTDKDRVKDSESKDAEIIIKKTDRDNSNSESEQKDENGTKCEEIPISLKDPIKEMSDMDKIEVKNLPKIHRHTRTYKYKLGKSKKNNNIGVFIKNRSTLKNIKRDFKELQNVDITEIKKYLRLHNLIKVGTSAPNDVLRELYEKAVLSGNINNNNSENLLYNFQEDE